MRGVQYSRYSRARQTFSSPIRNNGNASRHGDSPTFRYWTATVALWLSSPLIFHSNPRLMRVDGSTMKSPGTTALLFRWRVGTYVESNQRIVREAAIRVIMESPTCGLAR